MLFKLDVSILTLGWNGFDAYLAKIEHISMMMCHLTEKINCRERIANGTKL